MKFQKVQNITVLLAMASFVFAGSVVADKKLPPEEIQGMLLKEDAKVDLAYVRPDVDWSKYKSIYIRELSVTTEAQDATPENKPTGPGHARESWLIPEKDIELMKQEFTSIIKQAFEKQGISITDKITNDTLVIVPTIIDIYLNAPIEKTRRNYNSGGSTYTNGAGSMTLAATFADGETLRVLALAVDNKYPSSFWSRNSRMQNINDMKRLFRAWGTSMSNAINQKLTLK